jgi:hypothetical protein
MNNKNVIIGVTLSPIFWNEFPEFCIEFNNVTIEHDYLGYRKTFEWQLPAEDNNIFKIHFLNKKNNDTQNDKDKALVIDKIQLEGFTFDSILYSGKYFPSYPPEYYDYAKEHNLSVDSVLTQTTHLSFNGFWQLEFTYPVFEWIHRTENLGWLYERNI